jgi:hypothetical protein
MAYAAFSVVFGEQPSAAKWNILGSNDASFNDGTGIANLATSTTSISNPYKFSTRRTAAANTGTGTFAIISFDTELFDTNNNLSSGTYTVPVNGFYSFEWGVHASAAGASQTVIASLTVNGVEYARGSRAISNAAAILGSGGAATIQLTAGNTVAIYAFGTGSFALDVGAASYNYFSGSLISQT